nr:N protein of photosystem II [Pseudochlorella signiensis]AIT93838.1 N protein of photosystem II [Pseudochlorella signiensis]
MATLAFGQGKGSRIKNYKSFNLKLVMESPAFFYTIFLWCLLLSITGYSIYVGFGPPSKQLRDPFEEHED